MDGGAELKSVTEFFGVLRSLPLRPHIHIYKVTAHHNCMQVPCAVRGLAAVRGHRSRGHSSNSLAEKLLVKGGAAAYTSCTLCGRLLPARAATS